MGNDTKNTLNKRKYGVTFEAAQFILLGLSESLKGLVVCRCYHRNESEICMILARKATKKEQITGDRPHEAEGHVMGS
jgi:uncharacterized DUF497 family protein